MSARHSLTFRGQSHAIPAGYGWCTRCHRLLNITEWIDTPCPGRPEATEEEHHDVR
jgi:hypothetical protein